jgi:prophage regulatory protein
MSQKILKLPDVMKVTALSRSSIYAFISENTFPKPVQLGIRAVGWLENEIDDWIKQRAETRGVSK